MSRILLALILTAAAFSQNVKLEGDPNPQPKLVNAQLETVSAASGLKTVFDTAVRRSGPHWIGYSVASVPKSHFICCIDSWDRWKETSGCCSGCKLERDGGSNFINSDGGTCVNQEPQKAVFVLFRADNGEVGKIRSFTPDCGLDAGNLPVIWIQSVKSGESLALLDTYVQRWSGDKEDKHDKKLANGALQAIALHEDPGADRILERLLSSNQPAKMRQEVAFWTAEERGRTGFEMLKRIVPKDPDPRFRREATFALSQSSEQHDAALELISMARNDSDSEVRGQALFWLAQKASREAGKAISDAIENDPESRVREKAVFALSQMPKDEGVPLLIKYAKAHKDPRVRKQAIFWLGESRDPRALDFLEQVVLGKQ
jgi:HEAT repeat protein